MAERGYVSVDRIHNILRAAQELVDLCTGLIDAPDLAPVQRALSEMSAGSHAGASQYIGAVATVTDGKAPRLPAPGTFVPTSGLSYSDVLFYHMPKQEFTLTEALNFLRPLLKSEPGRFRDVVRAGIGRDEDRFKQTAKMPESRFRKIRDD